MFLPSSYLIIILFVGLLLILLSSQRSAAQIYNNGTDSVPKINAHPDSIVSNSKKIVDTGFKAIKSGIAAEKNLFTQDIHDNDSAIKRMRVKKPSWKLDSASKTQWINTYDDILKLSKPFFHFDDGYLAYNYNYHSSADTPYVEKNISQNVINASMNFSIEKYLPFTANAYISRSNSRFFRNITDVQIVFNAAAFHNRYSSSVKELYGSLVDSLKNPKLENELLRKRQQLLDLRSWLQNPFQMQKLIQANETLNIPKKSYNPSLSDSMNRRITDSLQDISRTFIKTYNEKKEQIDQVEHLRDSLTQITQKLKSLIARYKAVLNGGSQNSDLISGMEDSLRRLGIKNPVMPEKFNWLMNVRRFSIGKAPVNYTELTAKNISITGINMEYNDRYYLAFCGGLIDFRFNDPVVNSSSKVKQYMYMVRAGIGRVDNNHFILSFFQGKKQLFTAADSSGSLGTIPITGISAETQIRINQNSFLIGEVAQSLSPDYHFSPTKQTSGFNFSDNSNKAISLKAFGAVPATQTHLEGGYKFTGSNFQSFSFFQSNASLKSWYVKADQFFLQRKLKITVSIRTSDFSNPYIIQNYNSNTVFTNISASYRSRHFPSVTIGYMPMSQLTAVGSQIVENKFQTLTANLNHFYKVGSIRSSTTAVFSKFYNGGSDTAFVFYNASNILVQQSFFFKDFTGSLNFSRSEITRYVLNVAGEEINFPFSKRGSVGIGLKLNNYNQTENRVGETFNLNYQIGASDYFSVSADLGYLPGSSGLLVHNNRGNIQFVKRFK